MHLEVELKTDAAFSADRKYRWWLTRQWGRKLGNLCAFIGLNPSTADETQDDPTIRRCITFAESWEHDGLLMLNLFAYRSTDPTELNRARESGIDIIGQENYAEDLIQRLGKQFDVSRIIAAWGTGWWSQRGHALAYEARNSRHRMKFDCLMKTSKGDPKHPLYCPGGLLPEPWNYTEVKK